MGGSLYPAVEPDRDFRKDVFESQQSHRIKEGVASKLGELVVVVGRFLLNSLWINLHAA